MKHPRVVCLGLGFAAGNDRTHECFSLFESGLSLQDARQVTCNHERHAAIMPGLVYLQQTSQQRLRLIDQLPFPAESCNSGQDADGLLMSGTQLSSKAIQ